MASPTQLASRLGIPVSQITPQGVLEREFPGVLGCIPAGPGRDAFIRMGQNLLQAGLDDSDAAGDDMRYPSYRATVQSVLNDPELQRQLAACRPNSTQAPGLSSTAPSGVGPTSGTSVAAVVLVSAILVAAAWMAWLLTHPVPPPPAGPRRAGR